MSMDSRQKLMVAKRLLKTDFSEEEKAFRLNLGRFHSEIENANKVHEFAAPADDEKESVVQKIVANDVAVASKIPEQNAKIPKGNSTVDVELGNVSDPNCGDLTLQPAQPKEPIVSTTEDDIFGDCTSPDQKDAFPETSKIAPAKQESTPVDNFFGDDDFFGESKPEPKPQPKVDAPEIVNEPEPVVVKVTKAKAVPVEELGPPPAAACSTPDNLESDDFSTEIRFDKYTPEQLTTMGVSHNFIKMMRLLKEMLRMLPEVDLFRLASSLHEYAVDLQLDPEREDILILSRRMKEVEIKRDSLFGKLILLKQHSDALAHATEWIMKVGPGYSSASSEQKRVAEIKMLTDDVWLRYALVERVYNSFDDAYSHLGRQMDTISRLVTCDQNRLKHMEMRRGVTPYEDTPPWDDPKPQERHSPRPLPQSEAPNLKGEKEELYNQTMSQPLDTKKYKDLQSLPNDISTIAAKGSKGYQKGEINW